MKIAELRTYVLADANKHYLYAAIQTDRGIVGFGEATLDHRWPSVAAGIEEGFRAIAGQDPTTVGKHWSLLKDKVYWGEGASTRANAARRASPPERWAGSSSPCRPSCSSR